MSATLRNKVLAILLMVVGGLSILIEGDGTMCLFTLVVGIPLFFEKENWID